MGTSSGAFNDKTLDQKSLIIIKLANHAFGSLDRVLITAIERDLQLRPEQRRNIHGEIAKLAGTSENIKTIVRPIVHKRDHNSAHALFCKLCEIASHSQRYDMSVLKKLVAIGKALRLSRDEIYRLIAKHQLAI